VVGGTAQGLARAQEAFKTAGVRRTIPLKVSGPFHTPLMQEARDDMQRITEWVTFRDPEKPVYSNVTGERITSGAQARQLCLDQLVSTVNWVAEERQILEDGADVVIEVGPGTVLNDLWGAVGKADDTWPVDRCHNASTLECIESIARHLQIGQSHAS